MKLKWLFDLIDCKIEICDSNGASLYQGYKHSIDGSVPHLPDRIVTEISGDGLGGLVIYIDYAEAL